MTGTRANRIARGSQGELQGANASAGPWRDKGEGVRARVLSVGENVMVTEVEFAEGASAEQGGGHSHPNEQILIAVEGNVRVFVDGVKCLVATGESLRIPPGVSHSISAVERSRILNVFSPLRDDLLASGGSR